MSVTDEELYEVKARMISVLANPRRLHVVDLLRDGERTVGEIAESLGLAQAAASQHLALMRRAGLVKTRREGNRIFYRLGDPKVAAACSVMNQAIVDMLVAEQRKFLPVLQPAVRRSR
ncbi:MAG TPA: metalloregulator ArsR/SmtB family transcription factor [Thermoplasmata archaeon]|nr:metalloregulator ArsR/SmtB family transcription factor [Thermoplasmata archaeon]